MEKASVEYCAQLDGSTGTTVEFKIKTECHSDDEMRAALSFLAQQSHRFYLETADKIKCTL